MKPKSSAGGLVKSNDDRELTLKDENIQLKKKLNIFEERSKVLMTKVQKLNEDLKRTKSGEKLSHQDEQSWAEMNSQIQELTKANLNLRNKVQYFKTLHEAESSKRVGYSHIPPRVFTGQKVTNSLNVRNNRKPLKPETPEPQIVIDQSHEEKLQEMVNMLREQLQTLDKDYINLKNELKKKDEELEIVRQKSETDVISLQHQLSKTQSQLQSITLENQKTQQNLRASNDAYNAAVKSVEEINEELKDERRKCNDLESQLKELESTNCGVRELNEIIFDLQRENEALQETQKKLSASQFTRIRESELESEIEKLQDEILDRDKKNIKLEEEKSELLKKIKQLQNQLKSTSSDTNDLNSLLIKTQQELHTLRDRLRFLYPSDDPNGEIDFSLLEEALTILRLRKERGESGGLEFLLRADERYEEKRLLQELRIQHADCVLELESVRKLLKTQEHINAEMKAKVEEYKRNTESIRNEYELKLQNAVREIDMRSNRIAQLEAQLQKIAGGDNKAHKVTLEDCDETIELKPGQTILSIHIHAATFSKPGLQHLTSVGLVPTDTSETHLASFAFFDFFEFETQLTPLSCGLSPCWNHTSRFIVSVDEFVCKYLRNRKMTVVCCFAEGMNSIEFSKCSVLFTDLLVGEFCGKLEYFADLVSLHDNKTLVGKIEYSIQIHVPISTALSATSTSAHIQSIISEPPIHHYSSDADFKITQDNQFVDDDDKNVNVKRNDLIIRILKIENLDVINKSWNMVWAECKAAGHKWKTDKIRINDASHFNHEKVLTGVKNTAKFKDFIKNSPMTIQLFLGPDLVDSTKMDPHEELLCSASVQLIDISRGKSINGCFDLRDVSGVQNGQIYIHVSCATQPSTTYASNQAFAIDTVSNKPSTPTATTETRENILPPRIVTDFFQKVDEDPTAVETCLPEPRFNSRNLNSLKDADSSSSRSVSQSDSTHSQRTSGSVTAVTKEPKNLSHESLSSTQSSRKSEKSCKSNKSSKSRDVNDTSDAIHSNQSLNNSKRSLIPEVQQSRASTSSRQNSFSSASDAQSRNFSGSSSLSVISLENNKVKTRELIEMRNVSQSAHSSHSDISDTPQRKVKSKKEKSSRLTRDDTIGSSNSITSLGSSEVDSEVSNEAKNSKTGERNSKLSKNRSLSTTKSNRSSLASGSREILQSESIKSDERLSQKSESIHSSQIKTPTPRSQSPVSSISNYQNQRLNSNDGHGFHSGQVTIFLERLDFYIDSPSVREYLESLNVEQLFVSLEFMNFPQEDLETVSVKFDIERDGSMYLDYEKSFGIESKTDLHQIVNMLQTENSEEVHVVFAVVSEPPPHQSNAECRDIGVAGLNLGRNGGAFSESIRGVVGRHTDLEVWDVNGEIIIGKIKLKMDFRI
ncbi:X-linked retinitis pigmentosa GTPase regulator-interacting protein 1 [Nowakowskiella sp. JEL0407]|nr:X-linked retinitis pigmentosa GTPase regulator-interacting protein 1 [Nowakowskiella sp. JEL0407]